MAETYGYVNLISSFGFSALWRKQTVAGLPLGEAERIVDLMSGMGELWTSLAVEIGSRARVIGVDLSPVMAGRTRSDWPFATEVVVADALTWHCTPQADLVVSSFGLKTFDRPQQEVLASRVARMLKPGGRCSFLEISAPRFGPLRFLLLIYLNHFIPRIGRLLLGEPACYRMLGVYTEAFGDATYFGECLRKEGLEVEDTKHFWGCATGVRGWKP